MSVYLNFDTKTTLASGQDPIKSAVNSSLSYCLANIELRQSAEFTETLEPSETKTLITTRRINYISSLTEMEVYQPRAAEPTTWRIEWTGIGANPQFRLARNMGLTATTSVTITRLSGKIVRISAPTDFIGSNAFVGDQLLIEANTDTYTSPFATSNQGIMVKVVGVATTSVDVEDNGMFIEESGIVLGADFAKVLKVFNGVGVQRNDVLVNTDSSFNPGNRGEFKVTNFSSDWLEIEVDTMVPETVTGILSSSFYTAAEVIRFLALTATGESQIFIDNAEVKTSVLGDRSFLAGTFKCTEIRITNPNDVSIQVSGLYASTGFSDC